MTALDAREEKAVDLVCSDPRLIAKVRARTVPLGLTVEQRRALEFIRDFVKANGKSPTYQEIADALGLRSKAGVARLINALVERGHIAHMPARARSIVVLSDWEDRNL